MDRLNQLRGDVGSSREPSLDASSLAGEAYLTANESTKYFSLSQVDSSTSSSPPKESANDINSSGALSDAERIISNLSPIPKKSELDAFKIGDQIEAANILSGGVNIFDDNDNSYDGDELVIDDAAVESDDKPEELKLSEEAAENFEKNERLADTNSEEVEAGSSSKDTEVVLQIDGKNVDAIDIGNGLYLYRKDGEEELAAVQIMDDNQQQPDIKFLKVRENAEGNLEVYEEIEIEVPKEVPTKEGKAVKNTPHIPVKDLNSELASNKVAEYKNQTVPKDTDIGEVEMDVNNDNIHIESKTEVNYNGKMIKFSESRKSPLIGTFTPMTFHSTPNKEGIPLTKTMVDLQLHPNRHSENVKKTIEVHTDNCKQRSLDTSIKNTGDTNENCKRSESTSSSLDKDLTYEITTNRADECSLECIKDVDSAINENKNDDIITSNNDKIITLKHQQITPLDKNNVEGTFIKHDNIEMVEEKSSALERAQNNFNEQNSLKTLNDTNPINEICSTTNTGIEKSITEIHDLKTQIAGEKDTEYSISENTNVNSTVIKDTDDKGEKLSVVSDKDFVIVENQDTKDVSIKNNCEELAQKDTCLSKEVTGENPLQNNATKSLESSISPSNVITNQEISGSQHENKSLEMLDTSKKDVKIDNNVEIKFLDNHPAQSLTRLVDSNEDKNIVMNTRSEQTDLQKGMDIDLKSKLLQCEESAKGFNNLQKTSEIKKDVLFCQAESSQNVSNDLSKEKDLKPVSEFKQHNTVHKDNKSDVVEKKKVTDLKPNNKPIDVLKCSPKKPKTNDSIKLITTANEKIIKSNLSTVSDKKVDAELNKRVGISSITAAKAIETTCNPEIKSSRKALLTTEPKCTRNPLPPVKASNIEKTKFHNKNECNPKVPILLKNTKPVDSKMHLPTQNVPNPFERSRSDIKKEPTKDSKVSTPMPISDEYDDITEVPFGQWTEENRQIFLNRMKGPKVPTNTSNTKQLKQPNDLNRRDVLQKIDSQRQSNIASAKAQELKALNKSKLKHDIATFGSKSNITQEVKNKDNKTVTLISKEDQSHPATPIENMIGQSKNVEKAPSLPITTDMSNPTLNAKKDSVRRKEINNQDLIDKTIEGIINRAVTGKPGQEDVKQTIDSVEKPQYASMYNSVSLDEIESKMNELHGIPFVERPPHQLPQITEHDNKNIDVSTSTNKPVQSNEHKVVHSVTARVHEDSEEEIIEHIPVTGDIGLRKNNVSVHGARSDKNQISEHLTKLNCDSKREPIITENDFDKFARRNSITYENCLTVNFDGKEHHNVIHTVVEKETMPKKLSRNEMMLAESKAKCNKQLTNRHTNVSSKIPTLVKPTNNEDSYNKNYQSKVQIAYQSVMTAKRQQECPITIIEDKPVKVVFMEGNHEYTPHQFNVQGKELSPPKKSAIEWDHFMHSNSESLDSSESALDAAYDSKSQDDIKFKSKHQRKQVLTPVEAPDLELIEPGDLGIEVSPKKKRKMDDNKLEKNSKSLVPKKSYLLNRNITPDVAPSNSHNLIKSPVTDSVSKQDRFVTHSDPISAIDNLVKAAELLDNQTESKNVEPPSEQNSPTQQNYSPKRGRGRPRKNPLESGSDTKSPSTLKTPTPPKRPRSMDAKILKYETDFENHKICIHNKQLVKENWSMGEIDPKIICPICNKLFRTEYVVYKHVKHCNGPYQYRSGSGKRRTRRGRESQELDWKSEGSKSDSRDIDEDYETNDLPIEKRKSKENTSSDKTPDVKADIIEIEDTPVKQNQTIKKREKMKNDSNKITVNTKTQQQTSSLVCESCGKLFRQLSYLVSHRLQHKNIESKTVENDPVHKSLFSCEICKKEFRNLHHLVQHRNIHSMSSSRKRSSEQSDSKTTKEASKESEDQSAGFRCEPCDKSFRKLHHLVEHRETHDEINKKCNPVTSSVVDTPKPNPLHHCDICKKTFKKLQHLIDHKELHLDTGSEKSDDKSVKSSLSTRDIIHECPLCYMVFPNEHSLNKHHIICQRKKKQSAAKQSKQMNESEVTEIDDETQTTEPDTENKAGVILKPDNDMSHVVVKDELSISSEKQEATIVQDLITLETENNKEDVDNQIKSVTMDLPLKSENERKVQVSDKQNLTNKKDEHEPNIDRVTTKTKKHSVPTRGPVEIINISDTPSPKKRLMTRDKIVPTVTKRQKTTNVSLPDQNVAKTPVTSDDDEIRYMLNPDFQVDESTEGKLFMKVRAKKRNSLQIERPNSKDLMKRRISLQHPPKIPRLKVKPIPRKSISRNTVVKSSRTTKAPSEPAIDSDDSDVKYSFPESVMKEMAIEDQKKAKRQTVVEKRKSLSNIAKRKSLGKTMSKKSKVTPPPVKQIKKRSAEAEHRCDCGQLFSSVALLMRHTSLAHTPPRIRRRRSPPPDDDPKPATKRAEKTQQTAKVTKVKQPSPVAARTGVVTRKSSVNSEGRAAAAADTRKSSAQPRSVVKKPRGTAHKGVPVPEKMRKLMEKSKK